MQSFSNGKRCAHVHILILLCVPRFERALRAAYLFKKSTRAGQAYTYTQDFIKKFHRFALEVFVAQSLYI